MNVSRENLGSEREKKKNKRKRRKDNDIEPFLRTPICLSSHPNHQTVQVFNIYVSRQHMVRFAAKQSYRLLTIKSEGKAKILVVIF